MVPWIDIYHTYVKRFTSDCGSYFDGGDARLTRTSNLYLDINLKTDKHMKIINGILSSILGFVAMYLFLTAKTDIDFGIGFVAMLMGVIFLCFMMLEESKEEVERLRQVILKGQQR